MDVNASMPNPPMHSTKSILFRGMRYALLTKRSFCLKRIDEKIHSKKSTATMEVLIHPTEKPTLSNAWSALLLAVISYFEDWLKKLLTVMSVVIEITYFLRGYSLHSPLARDVNWEQSIYRLRGLIRQ